MTEQNTNEPKKRSRTKWVIASVVSLFILTLVVSVVAGMVFLPRLVESKAQEFVAEKFNRELTIRKLDIDLWNLTARLDGVVLTDPDSKEPFASFDHLFIELSPETFSEQAPVVKEIRLVNPNIHLVRYGKKHYNINDLVAYAMKPKEDDSKTNFSINNIQIDNGTIRIDDLQRKKNLSIEELNIDIPVIANIPTQVEIFTNLAISAKVNNDKIELVGKSRSKPAYDKKSGKIALKLDKLDLPTYLGYLPFDPGFKLKSGKFSADLEIIFPRKKEEKRRILVKGDVTLNSVWLAESAGATLLRFSELKVDIDKSDILSGKIGIGRIGLKNPEVFLDRNSNGQWNFERLLDAGKKTETKTQQPKNGNPAEKRPLVIYLTQLAVTGGQVFITDRTYKTPVNISARNIGINVENLSLDMDKHDVSASSIVSSGTHIRFIHSMPELLDKFKGDDKSALTQKALNKAAEKSGFHFQVKQAVLRNWSMHLENRQPKEPVVTQVSQLNVTVNNVSDSLDKPLAVSASARINDRGSYLVKGNVIVSPLKADLDVDFSHVSIQFIQPYINDYVNLSLRKADLSVKGKLLVDTSPSGVLQGQFKGGAAVSNLSAVDQMTKRPVISWKDLAFEGVSVNLNPLSVTIDKARMTDVVARVILLADGRLNLQNILRSNAGGQKSLTENEEGQEPAAIREGATPVAQAPVAPEQTKPGQVGQEQKKPETATQTVVLPAPDGQEKPDFSLAIKKWIIKNGTVRFSDNFIKPRYTANIQNLRGAFINLSNDPKTQSRIRLRGQVNGAPLDISGYVNPLSEKLTLNIKAQVTGMELAQFSAYSGKYLGYGIEKGKLTYKATYKVQNGMLTAENSLVLDQLTLGQKVESKEAISSSIELALALLKDSNGVIDLNVPISGSLNDPQFSLGSIVGKVILNTLKRIVTAPFAWLSSLNEKEKNLSGMIFGPGSATLSKDDEKRLERLANGLVKRPKLKLEITGLYDDVADREGLGQSTLDRKIRSLKRKKTGAPSFEDIKVSEKEYPELLREVYRNEKFDKPKELLIFDKNVPVPEMEKLLIQHYSTTDDNLILLANRRAEAVKNWLVLKGKVPDERIYLMASKKGTSEKDKPAHRVDFNLRWKN